MALSNKQRIGNGLDELKQALLPYLTDVLLEYKDGPRAPEIRQAIQESEVRIKDEKVQWDIQALIRVMIKLWGPIFTHRFDRHDRSRMRSLIGEANDVRNRHAHDQPFSYDDTYRDLDTLSRVAEAIEAKEVTKSLKGMAKAVMRVQFAEDRRVEEKKIGKAMEGTPEASLKPWREIVTPHSDVGDGNFLESEFVADLHAVHTRAAGPEYGKPVEFFARTFLTAQLKDLLSKALTRIAGEGGSPVIELKTNFGGGKTHSLLALYHLFSEVDSTELAGMDEVLSEVGIDNAPAAKRVVIAGHQLGVNQPRKKGEGVTINTLWGELAWQLGGKEAYETIRTSDESGTHPGAEAIAQLLRDASPCLILIDEWVAYLRDTITKDRIAAGGFESNYGFAQALTEATKVVPGALVVASLPASKIEMGGERGEQAFEQLSNLFKRVATPWQSASTEDGYEIVRRRLFDSQIDFPNRDAVVKAFYELYSGNRAAFPSNCSEQDYKRKLEACYPIHPELFDKLDSVWSTLEKFQKTRGVLRFMAGVIAELWRREDRNLLIMPASVPLDDSKVLNVVTEVLPSGSNWTSVINADIDGQAATATSIDIEHKPLGRYSACRRVARTVFIGAAPTSGANRGVDDKHLLLGCTQPGENAEKFGDALRRLSDQATYLYRDSARSWFALQPSVTRLAKDRTADFKDSDSHEVMEEIERRLAKWQGKGVFPGVQIAKVPGDLPDDPQLRLVLLAPEHADTKAATDNPALGKAEELLTQAGNKPRTNRNALIFLAPESGQLSKLHENVATYLAWKSIDKDKESLELTNHDKAQVETKTKEFNTTCDTRLAEAWNRILVPTVKDPKSGAITWETIPCQTNADKVQAVFTKLKQKDLIYDEFNPFHLKRELENHLWGQKDHISTREVSDAFGAYLFFPRLAKDHLLEQAIQRAFSGEVLLCEYFGYAEGYDSDTGKYLGLCATQAPSFVSIGESLLVKPEVANQHATTAKGSTTTTGDDTGGDVIAGGDSSGITTTDRGGGGTGTGEITPPAPPTKHRFFGTVELDPDLPSKSLLDMMDEVITHLSAPHGSKIKLSLEIEATNDETGYDESTVRLVSENAKVKGFTNQDFE